jgi:hypothetical protein
MDFFMSEGRKGKQAEGGEEDGREQTEEVWEVLRDRGKKRERAVREGDQTRSPPKAVPPTVEQIVAEQDKEEERFQNMMKRLGKQTEEKTHKS